MFRVPMLCNAFSRSLSAAPVRRWSSGFTRVHFGAFSSLSFADSWKMSGCPRDFFRFPFSFLVSLSFSYFSVLLSLSQIQKNGLIISRMTVSFKAIGACAIVMLMFKPLIFYEDSKNETVFLKAGTHFRRGGSDSCHLMLHILVFTRLNVLCIVV